MAVIKNKNLYIFSIRLLSREVNYINFFRVVIFKVVRFKDSPWRRETLLK